MKKVFRKAIWLVFFAVFVFSGVMLLRQWNDNTGGEMTYAGAMEIALNTPKQDAQATEPVSNDAEENDQFVPYWMPAPVEDDPVMAEMAQINLAALREVNPDVLGWIRIPDTKVDYPLLQGEDNDFYLQHTWDKTPNSVGSIFMEHLNSPDLMDYNTIIYGHNMNNGSMFSALQDFALQSHWQTHPYVYIVTDAGVYRYEIFAFSQASVESLTYGLNPALDHTKENFLDLSLENSRIDTGIRPAIADRILTLSTCSGMDYSSRYVLQARLAMVEVTE